MALLPLLWAHSSKWLRFPRLQTGMLDALPTSSAFISNLSTLFSLVIHPQKANNLWKSEYVVLSRSLDLFKIRSLRLGMPSFLWLTISHHLEQRFYCWAFLCNSFHIIGLPVSAFSCSSHNIIHVPEFSPMNIIYTINCVFLLHGKISFLRRDRCLSNICHVINTVSIFAEWMNESKYQHFFQPHLNINRTIFGNILLLFPPCLVQVLLFLLVSDL